MSYTTIYDISTEAYDAWLWAGIAGIMLLVSGYWFVFRPTMKLRWWWLGFAVVATLVLFVIPYWDHNRLQQALLNKTCKVVEGPVMKHWENKWAVKARNGYDRKHYEDFTVQAVEFGYFIRGAQQAGFTNSGDKQIPIYDGQQVRIHYITDKQIDDGSLQQRILKLEIASK